MDSDEPLYHFSEHPLEPGVPLEQRGYPFLALQAETLLEKGRPHDKLARDKSVYMVAHQDPRKTGVKHNGGVCHAVTASGPVSKHDLYWVNELERRYPQKPRRIIENPSPIEQQMMALLAPRTELAHLSDADLVERYWSGAESDTAIWEYVAASAIVGGQVGS